MKLVIPFLLCIFCSVFSAAQQKKGANPLLSVSWQPEQNKFNGENKALSYLTLTNKTGKEFPSTGWTIYFNSARKVFSPENKVVDIRFINGDLYAIKPGAQFKGMASGGSVKVPFVVEGDLSNITDAPSGLYLVWDRLPEQGFSLMPSFTVAPITDFLHNKFDSVPQLDLSNPVNVYKKNAVIQSVAPEKGKKVLPTPVHYQETGGAFKLDKSVVILADGFEQEAAYLSQEISKLIGSSLAITHQPVAGRIIELKRKDGAAEAYSLRVAPERITIESAGREGIFYGIQTVKLLMPPLSWKKPTTHVSVPGVQVEDQPRFGYRSFMLDIARNFVSKEELLKIIDLMALYKMNVLHLHFSDDEGWRIEIPSLPELTSVGSQRGHTLDNKQHLQANFGSGPDKGTAPGSGFYSRNDFIDILRYAKQHFVQVIPEVETPGHARAAVKAMEARYNRLIKEGKTEEAGKYLLSEQGDASQYRSVQGWNDNVMNVAMPSVYTFLEEVTESLIDMYKEAGAPLSTIHFGGDEVPAGVWEKSAAFLHLKSENPNVQTADDLWYYYYGRVNEMVRKKGVFLSGWEEMGMRKTAIEGITAYVPNPDFANDHFQLHVWNNMIGWGQEDLAYRLANAGYKVVLSPVTNNYLDMAYNRTFDEPGYSWGSYVDLDKPYSFIPFDYLKNIKEDKKGEPLKGFDLCGKAKLTDYGKSNIVGVQGLLWSENNFSPKHLEYMLLPKLLGVAERGWAPDPDWANSKDSAKAEALYAQAWSEFVHTIGARELARLSYYHGGFDFRIPPPGLTVEDGKVLANIQLPGVDIRYTTDGSEPTAKSTLYTGPVSKKGKIRAAAFDARGRRSRIMEIINQ